MIGLRLLKVFNTKNKKVITKFKIKLYYLLL